MVKTLVPTLNKPYNKHPVTSIRLTKRINVSINTSEDFMRKPVYIIIISNRDFAP